MFLTPALAVADGAPGCKVDQPTQNFSPATPVPAATDDAGIQQIFTAARAAEGCNAPLALPAGYDAMTPAEQTVWLINDERRIRGVGPLTTDATLVQQIAYNHSLEEMTYNYGGHASPINRPARGDNMDLLRLDAFAWDQTWTSTDPNFQGPPMRYFDRAEVIDYGNATPVSSVLFWIYRDGGIQGWGHRRVLLQLTREGSFVGVGVARANYTVDIVSPRPWPFAGVPQPQSYQVPPYAPPAKADTAPPVTGQLSYDGANATVSGVADAPANVNSQGANPIVPGITWVVFYTNNIVGTRGPNGTTFNTVQATQTTPGTWTAPIQVNPGDVLHAVAVNGSGDFADVTMPQPAQNLPPGDNTMALAAADPPIGMATDAAARRRSAPGSAAALARSIDRAGRGAVVAVRVYTGGHWRTYRPFHGGDFPLYVGDGVVVRLSHHVRWRPPASQRRYQPLTLHLHLHRGWNFVAVPYPTNGMSCHAVRLELAQRGVRLRQITVGPDPNHGVIMKPHHGSWGNDLLARIPYADGFWVLASGATDWNPSPTGWEKPVAATAVGPATLK